MLETCFSTAPGVTTRASAIALLVRPSAISESTSRSRGERASIGFSGAARRSPTSSATTSRSSAVPAVGDAADGVEESGDVADPLLQQVADAALAARQQLRRVDRLDVLGEDQDAEAGMAAARLDRGADPLVGEARRQPHVDDRQGGLVGAGDPQQPLPVLGLGDDLDLVFAQQRDQPLAEEHRVLGDHDPHGSLTLIRVPSPAGEAISNSPSSAATRRRSPSSPLPAARSAPPGPSSATITSRVSPASRIVTVALASGACLATLVSDSATTK